QGAHPGLDAVRPASHPSGQHPVDGVQPLDRAVYDFRGEGRVFPGQSRPFQGMSKLEAAEGAFFDTHQHAPRHLTGPFRPGSARPVFAALSFTALVHSPASFFAFHRFVVPRPFLAAWRTPVPVDTLRENRSMDAPSSKANPNNDKNAIIFA